MLFKEKLYFLKQKKYLLDNNLDNNLLDNNLDNNLLDNNLLDNSRINIIKEYIPNIIKINDEYLIPYNNNNLRFKICNNQIIFIDVFNCELIYGTYIIENMIKIAKKLNIKYIDLQDETYIKINKYQINLSVYSILLYGISWFNKYDFLSIDHLKNIKFNEYIRNLTLTQFKYNINQPIWSVIKYINSYLKKNKYIKYNDEKVLALIELIDLFKNLLKYNNKIIWINKDLLL